MPSAAGISLGRRVPGQKKAVFIDVGGPIYPDDNFLHAAHLAINEIRSSRSEEPVTYSTVREVFDRVRNRSEGSLRGTLADEFLGHPGDRDLLHDTIAPLWVHPEGTLYPDVLGFLRSLHGQVTIGVLANQETATVEALRRDEVAPFIDVWGISAAVGVEKPSPEFFLWALQQAAVEPEHAVHIGNRFTNDVLPAHSLGLKTVWLLRGEAPDDPPSHQRELADIVVDTLEGLGPRVLGLFSQ